MFVFMVRRFLFYWKLVALSLFRAPRDRTAPLSGRRIIVLLVLNTAGVLVFVTNWVCLLLDEVLFPGYRKVEVRNPLFILGVPRSGSTFFQRLLSRDKENFISFKLWEIIFAPSIIQRKTYSLLGRLDHRIGEPITTLIKRIDTRLFASSRQVHQVGLFQVEEDGVLLIWIFSTLFLFFAYPFIDQYQAQLHFDDHLAAKDKELIMRYYSGCVRRHLYCHGADKMLLSKNPTFAPMIRTLARYFPDARFISTVRTPYQQIPSIFSLLVYFIGRFGGDFQNPLNSRKILFELIEYIYLNPINYLKKLDKERYQFVRYDDLVKDVGATVRYLYRKFDLEISPEFETLLDQQSLASRGYKSEHSYTLEQFGLTRGEIWEHFRQVFDEFGFDPH